MAQEEIVEQDGVQYLVNHEAKTYKPIGFTKLPDAASPLKALQAQVQPKSSADVLVGNRFAPRADAPQSGMDPAVLPHLLGRTAAAIPGVISDIANIPTPTADKYPAFGPQTSALTKLWTHFITNNPGTVESVKNAENDPLTAAFNIWQAKKGIEGLAQLPSAAKGAYHGAKSGLVNWRAGLGKAEVPFNINSLELAPTTNIQTAESLAKQGINMPLPAVGEGSTAAKEGFAASDVGKTTLRETQQKISNAVSAMSNAPKKQALNFLQNKAAQDEVTAAIPDLITKGRDAFNPATKAALDLAGDANLRPLIWKEIYSKAATGENGILDAEKLISFVSKNGKNLRGLLGADQSAALQEFAHGLKRTQSIGGAITPTQEGFEIAHYLPALAKTTQGVTSRMLTKAGQLAGRITVNSETFSKLMADPEGKWLLARIAGKASTDPSLVSLLGKLSLTIGKIGASAKVNAGGSSHNLGEEQ